LHPAIECGDKAVIRFADKMRSTGMSAADSGAKIALLERVMLQLREMRSGALDDFRTFFVPGRVELVGKHTDYAGGRSIVCAINRGICLAAAPRRDARVRIFDVARKSEVEVKVDPEGGSEASGPGHWSNYALAVARRFARDFPLARAGADITLASDLPAASGMSSSSALLVAIFFALAEMNSLWRNDAYARSIRSREDLAAYLAAVESGEAIATFSAAGGVGTLGGSEDHVAILCSRPGYFRQYSYCPVRLEREIPVPKNYVLVIAVSGVEADKAGKARDHYNRSSLGVRKLLELWKISTGRNDPCLAAALSSASGAAALLEQVVREKAASIAEAKALSERLHQFLEESTEIVPAVGEALSAGEMDRVGRLVDRSQGLAETLLANQVPETIALARSARRLGAAAASAFGAGFGGSVWALVPQVRGEEFRDAWADCYRRTYPERAKVSETLLTNAGPGLIEF
jgi:galactokinase